MENRPIIIATNQIMVNIKGSAKAYDLPEFGETTITTANGQVKFIEKKTKEKMD